MVEILFIIGWGLAIYYKYSYWKWRNHCTVHLDKNMVALIEDLMMKFDAAAPGEVIEISIALLDMVTNEELINKTKLGFFDKEGRLTKFWGLELIRSRKRSADY